jgi:hypothetical protein
VSFLFVERFPFERFRDVCGMLSGGGFIVEVVEFDRELLNPGLTVSVGD